MCQQCEDHDADRRAVLLTLAGGVAAATVAGEAQAQTGWDVRGSDAITAAPVEIPHDGGAIGGFLAAPAGRRRRRRGVVIMHGNAGLSDDVANTAAQLAVAGFAALAIDWAKQGQDWRTLGVTAWGAQQIAHARAGMSFLLAQPGVRGERVGFVGFCGGGRTAFDAAAYGLPVACIVSFYGAAITRVGGPLPTRDPRDIVGQVDVPVQGHYGALDEVAPVEDARPLFETLEQRQPRSEFFAYEGAGHRFYNMTVPAGSDPGYDFAPAAADAAHRRMIAFLRRTLR